MSVKSDQATIPAGKLSAYERWELPAVDPDRLVGRDSMRSEEDLPVSPLTAEQVEQVREAAHREGFEQGQREGLTAGHAEGLARAEAELRAQTGQVQALVQQLLQPARDEQAALEAALIDLVIRISESVIGRELMVDGSVIAGLVRDAVAALPEGHARINITLNPEDLKTLESNGFVRDESWNLLADTALAPGGCRVAAGDSLIDYTVDERFRKQVESLVEDRYRLVANLLQNMSRTPEQGR